MLSLKRNKKNQDLIICLKEQKGIDNHLFWVSLTLALLIHLGAFFLFHIQPFKIDSSYIFPIFQMEALKSIQKVSSERDEKENILTSLKPPPEIDLFAFMPLPTINQEKFLTIPDWQNYPAKEEPYCLVKHFSSLLTYHPWEMVISGPLTQLTLLNNPTPSLQRLTASPLHLISNQVIFEVQVDVKKGCICWFEKKQGSGQAKIDQFVEHLLLSLSFAPHPTKSFIKGEIEWTFTEENKKDD